MFDFDRIKAVLWDLDDTLYSRFDAARQTFPGMFRRFFIRTKQTRRSQKRLIT